jgi:hypothetical protein
MKKTSQSNLIPKPEHTPPQSQSPGRASSPPLHPPGSRPVACPSPSVQISAGDPPLSIRLARPWPTRLDPGGGGLPASSCRRPVRPAGWWPFRLQQGSGVPSAASRPSASSTDAHPVHCQPPTSTQPVATTLMPASTSPLVYSKPPYRHI